jgi:hypothetical protein
VTEPRAGAAAEARAAGPDVHAPWREAPDTLRARHVGRHEVVESIREAALAFARGGRPLPMYLFGPRGIGKSHVLEIAAAELRAPLADLGVAIAVVPDDIPALRSADDLLARIPSRDAPPRWQRWRGGGPAPAGAAPPRERRAVLVEGLDRQLRALGARERKRLRHLLDRDPDIWVLGTGASLTRELTRTTEAFYGAFDAWPLEPLHDDDAASLVDLAAADAAGAAAPAHAWAPRRGTLVLLGGGNPRFLVALARAGGGDRARSAADLLRRAIATLAPEYRQIFRNLSPNSQRLVELMAEAPRELSATELASELRCSVAQISVQAGRLVDEGVLRHRSEGRQGWYRLAEPSFRFWLECKSARWENARIAWVAPLVEAVVAAAGVPEAWRASSAEALASGAAPGDAASDSLTLGLASIAYGSPEPHAELGRVPPSPLRAAAERATLLVDQLRGPPRAQLHPELEMLRRAVEERPASSPSAR